MDVAIYVRVSTKDGRQNTDNQRLQLEDYAARQGWRVYKVYEDHRSGKSAERDSLKEMFGDARKRFFDVLLFWSLDRFSREGTVATIEQLARLTRYNISYFSFTEPYLDTCGIFKDAVVAILAAVAKQERVRLSERTVAGLARARRAGRLGGRRPLPFDLVRAQQMREAGDSYYKIGDVLGVPRSTVMHKLAKAAKQVQSVSAEELATSPRPITLVR